MRLAGAVLFLVLSASAASNGEAIQGDWRGESICQQKNTACRDERVIYHISAPDGAGKVTVSADKVVDGKAVNMGTISFEYNKTKGTLDSEDGPRTWHFKIDGHSMHGALMTSGTLIRKVELTRN